MILNSLFPDKKRIRPYAFPFALFTAVFFISPTVATLPATAANSDQLIIFVQPTQTPVARQFETQQLPEIRKIAETLNLSVILKDASQGAPPEVAITPLIVYQNHRGRSIYQGRTTTPDRIRNFIRTARVIVQKEVPNHRENIPVWKTGRTRVWAPLKVSGVTGTPPDDYEKERFIQTSLTHIVKGFSHFELQQNVDLGRADRGFYMDFYPWLAEDGTLFLSLALYSQFHCKEPIFKTKDKPLVGPWKKRWQLFEEAAALMEKQVENHMADPNGGDGFDPVPTKTADLTWQALGLALPEAPAKSQTDQVAEMALSTQWKIAQPSPDDPPTILFRFPAPLDLYRGEVVATTGQLTLPDDLTLNGTKGFIEVDTRSAVTMGDPVLNEAIQGSLMLYSRKYPASRFEITSIGSENRPLSFGQLTPASMSGKFTLKGKTIDLTVPTEIEPIIGDDHRPRLLMRSAFGIDLNRFDIEGADGPAPASHTLLFDVNAVLEPLKME